MSTVGRVFTKTAQSVFTTVKGGVKKTANSVFESAKNGVKNVRQKNQIVDNVLVEVEGPLRVMRTVRTMTINSATRAQAVTNPSKAKKLCNGVANQAKGFGKGMLALVKKAGPVHGTSALAGCALAWRFAPFLPGTSIGLATSVILKTLFKTIFRV